MSKVHVHLLVSGKIRNPNIDEPTLIAWMRELVSLVDMEIFMEPRARYCDDPTNSGITGDVVITTSHSSIHIWDKPEEGLPFFEFDLYTCRDIPSILTVMNHFAILDPVHMDYMVINRSDKTEVPRWTTFTP